jgi:hypothetical protein
VNNQKKTLRVGKGLWITRVEDEQLWLLMAWLISQSEVQQALLAASPKELPMISY